MTAGGARNRSGPSKNLSSARSSGLEFTQLPAEGYDGEIPEFPLKGLSEREGEVWAGLWRSPQAAAWAVEPWRWPIVAMYTRLFVRVEDPESSAGITAQLHRFADQIGMTPAGLKENGWVLARDEVTERRKPAVKKASARDRLKAVANGS